MNSDLTRALRPCYAKTSKLHAEFGKAARAKTYGKNICNTGPDPMGCCSLGPAEIGPFRGKIRYWPPILNIGFANVAKIIKNPSPALALFFAFKNHRVLASPLANNAFKVGAFMMTVDVVGSRWTRSHILGLAKRIPHMLGLDSRSRHMRIHGRRSKSPCDCGKYRPSSTIYGGSSWIGSGVLIVILCFDFQRYVFKHHRQMVV